MQKPWLSTGFHCGWPAKMSNSTVLDYQSDYVICGQVQIVTTDHVQLLSDHHHFFLVVIWLIDQNLLVLARLPLPENGMAKATQCRLALLSGFFYC